MSEATFEQVAVLGAGTMGRGIAQVAATAGSQVRLVDASEEQADAARQALQASLQRAAERGHLEASAAGQALERVSCGADVEAAVRGADVVVEAVPEDLQLKRELFARLAACAPPQALLGSNTSSLSITRLAAGCGAEERVVGLHFFNPVPRMALLEIVRGESTSSATLERARAFAAYLGKDPIEVRDAPGFATSRLGVLLGLEAIRMVQEQVASPADIDKALELGYRHPMGPLKLTDLVGLDVRLAIAEHLHKELDSPRFEPPELLREMVAAGRLGKKTGEGFYSYTG